MRRFAGIAVFVVLTVGVLLLGWGALRALAGRAAAWHANGPPFLPFAIGAGAWLLLLAALRPTSQWATYRFLSALNHELMHVLAGLLTGGRPEGLSISNLGSGNVVLHRPNFLVALAPYLLSLPLVLVFLLLPIVSAEARPILVGLLGAAFGDHLLSLATCVRPNQTDFRYTTFPVAVLWVLAALACVSGVCAGLVIGGWTEASGFLVASATEAWAAVASIPHLLGRT